MIDKNNISENETLRGGAREGAGRKPKENARNIRASFMLSDLANSNLNAIAVSEKCSKNDVINRLLERIPKPSLEF